MLRNSSYTALIILNLLINYSFAQTTAEMDALKKLGSEGFVVYVKNDKVTKYDLDGTGNVQLQVLADGQEACVSQDGAYIAYIVAVDNSSADMWVMDPHGGNKKKLTAQPVKYLSRPAFSNAHEVLYSAGPKSMRDFWAPQQIYMIDLSGNITRLLDMSGAGTGNYKYISSPDKHDDWMCWRFDAQVYVGQYTGSDKKGDFSNLKDLGQHCASSFSPSGDKVTANEVSHKGMKIFKRSGSNWSQDQRLVFATKHTAFRWSNVDKWLTGWDEQGTKDSWAINLETNERIKITFEGECKNQNLFIGNPPPPPPPPEAITNLAVSAIGHNQATITWGEGAHAVSYDITWNGGGAATSSNTTYTMTGLLPETDYTVSVKSKNSTGASQAVSVDFTTDIAPPPGYLSVPAKINVGGDATNGFLADIQWQDSEGYGYIGDASSTASGSGDVSATDDDDVYRTVRFKSFDYKLRVPNGDYTLALLFAEFWRDNADGRTFTARINGIAVDPDPVDIYKAVGKNSAYTISLPVQVSNEIIEITFDAHISDPMISGIELQGSNSTANSAAQNNHSLGNWTCQLVSNMLKVNIYSFGAHQIDLIDARGRRIKRLSGAGVDNYELDVTNAPAGMYVVTINVDGHIHKRKLILQQ